MPDAQGNFKGISVSAEAWERVFGDRMHAHDHDWPQNPSAGGTNSSVRRWPNQREAQERGCTCQWWGRGYIAEFDPACPIVGEHRH